MVKDRDQTEDRAQRAASGDTGHPSRRLAAPGFSRLDCSGRRTKLSNLNDRNNRGKGREASHQYPVPTKQQQQQQLRRLRPGTKFD